MQRSAIYRNVTQCNATTKRNISWYNIGSNRGCDMAIFRFFKMEHSAILDFRNFKFLTVVMVKRVKLRHRAKFHRNRSKLEHYIAIFQFFQDGSRLPSWICDACVGTTHEGHLVVFITAQNLVRIDAVGLIICTFLISRVWLENAYSRPKMFFGIFSSPKWGGHINTTLKGTSLRESASFELSCVKIRRRVWSVGEFLKTGHK